MTVETATNNLYHFMRLRYGTNFWFSVGRKCNTIVVFADRQIPDLPPVWEGFEVQWRFMEQPELNAHTN